MIVDRMTWEDLSIFNKVEEHSVFHYLDFTRTSAGREQLKKILSKPLDSIEQIEARQHLLQHLFPFLEKWPQNITNGTLMVLDTFYKTPIASIPEPANLPNSLSYQLLNRSDYNTLRYTVQHFISVLQGLQQLIEMLADEENPAPLQRILEDFSYLLSKPDFASLATWDTRAKLSPQKVLRIGTLLYKRKQEVQNMLSQYGLLDAWYSLARAFQQHHFSFPIFEKESNAPIFQVQKLFHPLLSAPVAYDLEMGNGKNFLFLTGANMGGKSTFIKAIGIGAYMAHLGIGVPAESMRISLLDGLLSNIQIADNILQGESYFFNEVQRIKQIVERLQDGKKWLILIDELFKGTNVQDAMRCSKAVIEGLHQVKSSLFVLSTHLYEIADEIAAFPNILFKYFETNVLDNQLKFSYQLLDGVSNDRIGYLILRNEGIVDSLKKLSN